MIITTLQSGVLAGERAHTVNRPTIRPALAAVTAPSTRTTSASETITVSVAAPKRAGPGTDYVELVGPDGQTRRFSLEGGADAIEYTRVVLRPGQTLNIHLLAAK
jgi:hypothetical protein